MLFAASIPWGTVVVGLLCTVIGFLASNWIKSKDKIDESHETKLGQIFVGVAEIKTTLNELPCRKAQGGNSIPPNGGGSCSYMEQRE